MRWLVTAGQDRSRIGRYLDWIGALSVQGVPAASLDGLPGDLREFDALLLSGGSDINPAMYGQVAHVETSGVDDLRDAFELAMISEFMNMAKPVFGICRGVQILSVALGGRLIQHLPDIIESSGSVEEHRALPGGKGDVWHGVELRGESFSWILNESGVAKMINSAHHQALDPVRIGKGLKVTAVSPTGVVEAVEGVGLSGPVLAVQWHPERMPWSDPASGNLLRAMIGVC